MPLVLADNFAAIYESASLITDVDPAILTKACAGAVLSTDEKREFVRAEMLARGVVWTRDVLQVLKSSRSIRRRDQTTVDRYFGVAITYHAV